MSEDPSSVRLFVYAFVWPPGRKYEADVDENRNPVGYYFESLRRSSEQLASRFVGSRFIVHMHPKCAHLESMLGAGFKVVYCSESAHWRFPVLHRATTTLSHQGLETVIQLDAHDPPTDQIRSISELEHKMRHTSKPAGMTFWPTDGEPIQAHEPWQGPTELEFRVFAAGSARPWWIDAGLIVTNGAFRRALDLDYGEFLTEALLKYNNLYVDFESISDEGLLDLALFKNRARAAIVKEQCAIAPHWLQAAEFDFQLRHSDVTAPEYAPQNLDEQLGGGFAILMPGQDTTMDAARIRGSALRFGEALALLSPTVKQGKKRITIGNDVSLLSRSMAEWGGVSE